MNVILNLTINRKWFALLASGEKREEYRSADNAQVLNAFVRSAHRSLGDDAVMILRNGYRMDSPAIAVHVRGVTLRKGSDALHAVWGEPTDSEHFVIMLGDVMTRGTYADVKKHLEKGDQK